MLVSRIEERNHGQRRVRNISPDGAPFYLNDSILAHSNRIRFLERRGIEFTSSVEEANESEADSQRFVDANPDMPRPFEFHELPTELSFRKYLTDADFTHPPNITSFED